MSGTSQKLTSLDPVPTSSHRAPTAGALAALLAVASVTACGSGGNEQLVVFAASSLTDVFADLEIGFEAEHPGVDVVISLDGSSSLAAQIEQGAPADVFAAADESTMARVVAEVGGTPEVFARNRLTIAVEEGNPLGITGLADLADPDLVIVLAAPEVPAGAYAAQALEAVGVTVEPDSFEQSVRSVASKVALGEADAGIVYRTDVAADPDGLDEVAIGDGVTAVYPILAIGDGSAAEQFVAFLLGPTGRAALTDAGFEVP
jgi:molybdate transport system substrate-binding protein